MQQDIKDKAEWLVVFTSEFGHCYGLTLKQAYNYLLRFKGIDFAERNYSYLHTQSFASVVSDMAEYCRKMGGKL